MTMGNNLLEREFTPELCCELLPEWDRLEIKITQLSGGITNKLYRIQSEKGDYTVRIYGDKTDLFINRDQEIEAQKAMAAIGVGAPLVKYMPERRVTIVEFIDHATVLTNDHFLDPTLVPKIVEPIRKIHSSDIVLEKMFNPLVEIKKMADILTDLDASYAEFDISGTLSRLETLSEIIAIPEEEYTACHNDLLADNFILINEKGKNRYPSPMYIIDWEYAGMAPKYYDIADMFQEILVPRENEREIVKAYCNGDDFDRVLYYIDLFKPFPDIYWFLWSLIQLNISKISFDYYNYGKVKYDNAMKNLAFIRSSFNLDV